MLRPAIVSVPIDEDAVRESVPELLSESAEDVMQWSSTNPESTFTSLSDEEDTALTKLPDDDVCELLLAAPRSRMSINPVGGTPDRCGSFIPLLFSVGEI